MKKILLLTFLFQVFLSYSQEFETVTLLDNGPSDRRINLGVMGDGYDASEQNKFISDANGLIDYLFTKPPFSYYQNYFNVYAIKVISPESGVKHPGTATDVEEPVFPVSDPNNYLLTTFDYNEIHRCIYSLNTNLTTAVLAANVPFFDSAFVVVNSPEYGGCAGTYSYFSAHVDANEILVHELGHSFSGLADEYWTWPGEGPNKTQDNNPETNKWRNWIGTNGVGIYPFTENTAWFRPHQSCLMRYLGQPFCMVCSHTTIERIHALQGPIDTYTPTETNISLEEGSIDFDVNLILPEPNYLEFEWTLNGEVIDNENTTVSLHFDDLNPDGNTLSFTVTDETPWVRRDNHAAIHFDVVSWNINGAYSTENIDVYTANFVVYPNPTAEVVYVKTHTSQAQELTFELVTLHGQIVKREKVQKDHLNVFTFETGNLATQTYILNLYNEHGGFIYSHKLIKE
jgi:hypothetical protein